MITKEFKRLKLTDIHPYKNNPRRNDEAVEDVIASIQQCENIDPIEVDEKGVILSGHTRLKALAKMGYDETDCLVITGLTEKQKKKYRLLTNKTGEKSGWDFGLLDAELDGMDFEGFDFGFKAKTDQYISDFFESGQEPLKVNREVFGVKIITETMDEAKELKNSLESEGYIVEVL